MKEEKIFKAVKYVDDDLICEMAEYSPEIKTEGKAVEGVKYNVPEGRVRRFWRYPAAAAVVLGVVGCTVVMINYGGGISDFLNPAATDTQDSETAAETGNYEETETSDVQTEVSATEEEPNKIVPKKAVAPLYDNGHLYLFTDSYPEIPQSNFDEKYFTEISTEELFKYYGMYAVPEYLESGDLVEAVDENTRHGIYTMPNGSVYDLNTFVFEYPEILGMPERPKRFTVTVGKYSIFGQEYILDESDYRKYLSNADSNAYICDCTFYNEEDRTFFFICNFCESCCVMFSGNADEMSDFDDPRQKDIFVEKADANNGDVWKDVPPEAYQFPYAVNRCLREGIRADYSQDMSLAELLVSKEGPNFKETANKAAAAYLQNDKETLSQYMVDPNYKTGLSENSKNLKDELVYMTLKIPSDSDTLYAKESVYPITYEFVIKGTEMKMYLDLGLRLTDSGWRVEYIDLQG